MKISPLKLHLLQLNISGLNSPLLSKTLFPISDLFAIGSNCKERQLYPSLSKASGK